MQIKNTPDEELRDYFKNIENYLTGFQQKWIKYLDLGCKVVRLVSYSDEFLPHVEKQLTFILRDTMPKYDATIVLWKETDIEKLAVSISPKLSKNNPRIRIESLYKKETINLEIIDNNFSKTKPVIDIQKNRGYFYGNDYQNNTYYFGVGNLEPEEFIKEGHLFVQILNNILKTSTSNLAHGAVIGLNGDGICFCARGQRGKSTLSVLSMMKGFEYVSDDYLILHQDNKGQLLSSPIYSIITLSPKMYNELYGYLEGSRFVSNNARKDKYVFNIANFHDRFRMNYPIKFCMFPEIVTDPEPSIKPCSKEEKGRAVVQLIQSTLMQTQDLSESRTVKKMMNMIKDLPFYKFNLCHNIDKNTEFLRDFMNNFQPEKAEIIGLEKICLDITFDLANILNSETGIIYSMNKFATNIFENLMDGVSPEDLLNELKPFADIEKDFNLFIEALKEKDIFKQKELSGKKPVINIDFARENNFKLSFIEYVEDEYKELIKENKNELCAK